MEIVRNNVKIEWVDLGEGRRGDYDPDNPDDIALLRFDVYVKIDGVWTEPADSSYCTLIPVKAPLLLKMTALQYLMDEIYEPASQGHSIKKLCERLSWISPRWVEQKRKSKRVKAIMDKFDEFVADLKEIHG